MTPTLFLVWREPRGAPSLETLAAIARLRPGVVRALVHFALEPAPESPFAADGRGPALTLELGFSDRAALEASAAALAEALPPPSQAQAMLGRRFATPDSAFRLSPGERPCTLLVAYPGGSDDLDAWLDHYDAHHPAIMVRFPGVRDVATFRPIEARLPASWRLGGAMQRNKVVFDSQAALAAALASPVRQEMRADFEAFPPFVGRPTHFPAATVDLLDPSS